MAGIFPIDAIRRTLLRRKREQRLARAAQWPIIQAEINHWQVLTADDDVATTGAPYQIEAGFHFKVNGEYFGGYLRSIALVHREAETNAKGNPTINIRYNPANPDETAVFAEDNASTLPFRIISS
ncbi:DUF3592 domain-containing protein [Granulicella sp. L60]|jgi:hypothetical protein|uniref:DUF3592 domain-containing protein n=1 Tax=Granulicella sp. L60 TaxID=1641866 RepID=UPI00131DD9CC|nr:DUF3592 domain-containing protein [Granulicella sp. L60]